MRMIFVRHGDPNYRLDCLTELGHLQAEAAAERLADERIERIFASTCGRATETAQHIAARHGLAVEPLEFMREIGWDTLSGCPLPSNGHPWSVADYMVAHGECINNPLWATEEPFCRDAVTERALRVGREIDALLAALGYAREGGYYRIQKASDLTYILVSHGGSGSAALAHIFDLPFPYVCGRLHPDFTSVSIVSFSGDTGELVAPRIDLLNDARHIVGLEAPAVFGK